MTKTFSTWILACIWLQGFTQPMIDGSNFILPEDVFTYQNANPVWLGSQGLTAISGAAQVWDVSDFTSFIQSEETYVGIAATPNLYQIFFSNSTLYPASVSTHAQAVETELPVILPIEVSNAFNYYRNDDTAYVITGSAFSFQGFPIITRYDPVEELFSFPVQFGDSSSTDFSSSP